MKEKVVLAYSGGLDTKKLMVRRQLYNLSTWIIAFIILTKSRLSVRNHNAIKYLS